jgi:hypothetical protein
VVVDVEQGGLILRHAARRLVLLDSEGIAVDVRQLRPDESIRYGDELEFPCYAAIVGELIASPTAPVNLSRSSVRPRRKLGCRELFAPSPKRISSPIPANGQNSAVSDRTRVNLVILPRGGVIP